MIMPGSLVKVADRVSLATMYDHYPVKFSSRAIGDITKQDVAIVVQYEHANGGYEWVCVLVRDRCAWVSCNVMQSV